MVAIHHAGDLAAKKAELSKRVDDMRAALFDVPGYLVPPGISTALGGKYLQTRLQDQANWLTAFSAYTDAISAGKGDIVGASFRTADNSTISVSFNEAVAVLQDLRMWGGEVYAYSWGIKDAIAAASTPSDIIAIDIDSGWPRQ